MNIQQMKYVIEVERTGSISQAAENLYMSQPNLSKAIKQLELSLGIRIFKRTPCGVSATADGAALLADIKKILRQIKEVESRYKTDASDTQNLSISVPRCGSIAGAFTSFIAELDDNNALHIELSETDPICAINNITEEGYQLGIIRYHINCERYFFRLLSEHNLGYKRIWEFENLALMSKEHLLSQKSEIKIADLNTFVEICHSNCAIPKHPQEAICDILRSVSGQKRICIHERGCQFDLLRSNPRTYMWSAPMPDEMLSRLGLVQKYCGDFHNICRDILIFPLGHRLKGLESLFFQKLKEEKKRIPAR